MKPILTMDFETDPFSHGHSVKPFACGLYNGKNCITVWSPDCAAKMMKVLEKLPPSIVYMHNGGKFDIFFCMPWLAADLKIINGRIVKGTLCGRHEFRDSFSILPMALKAMGGKKDIDIDKLHRSCRDLHRVEILEYLKQDCIGLHELVTAFWSEFGDYLTIGSAALAQLKRFHPFENSNKKFDESLRKDFYFGGRVQCFQSGIIEQPFKIFDVRSMYPYVMANRRHPISTSYSLDTLIGKDTAFIVAEGENLGAFPTRLKKGGIDFTGERGTYYASIHEWNYSLETSTFKPSKVLRTYNFDEWTCFEGFVSHYFNARLKAIAENDNIKKLFYKLILNSSYGKFAQNPENFRDYCITHNQQLSNPWIAKHVYNHGEYTIWEKPTHAAYYNNVAVGASITGAARGVLRQGLSHATDLIYCDTDSIICRDLSGVSFGESLGDWQLEASGNRLAIAGKKLYACFNGEFPDGLEIGSETCIKSATKGARISPAEIVRVARGETVTYKRDAPSFKLDGSQKFITRRIRKTA